MWYLLSNTTTNYNSNPPKSHKLGVIIGLLNRAISLTSPEYCDETLKKVDDISINNDNPLNLIHEITTYSQIL